LRDERERSEIKQRSMLTHTHRHVSSPFSPIIIITGA
jgi:hypothetical protein